MQECHEKTVYMCVNCMYLYYDTKYLCQLFKFKIYESMNLSIKKLVAYSINETKHLDKYTLAIQKERKKHLKYIVHSSPNKEGYC